MTPIPSPPAYRGRFAPSPTGPLHAGSLATAVGSYLEARSRQGEWLVRMEDLDPSRTRPAAATRILGVLERFGMQWDGEVLHQSRRSEAYRAALALLEGRGMVYPCTCSRREIAHSSITGVDGPIYPGTCRDHRVDTSRAHAMRVRTDNAVVEIVDGICGVIRQRLKHDVGDFVLRRADGVFTYQLAVVVDDAEQGVTHVVRGSDLLASTPRQIHLQHLLGYPTPAYMHLPLVVNVHGEKLGKQTHAPPLDPSDPVPWLIEALHFLGQQPPAGLAESGLTAIWEWATRNWKPGSIPSRCPHASHARHA